MVKDAYHKMHRWIGWDNVCKNSKQYIIETICMDYHIFDALNEMPSIIYDKWTLLMDYDADNDMNLYMTMHVMLLSLFVCPCATSFNST